MNLIESNFSIIKKFNATSYLDYRQTFDYNTWVL